MSTFLRKLANKAHFVRQEWLEDDDVPSDALGSFMTKDSALSVWAIEDDRSNLRRVIAALAASRDSIDKLDYALVDESALDITGVFLSRANGRSPDGGANALWHQDLNGLSGKRLVALALNTRGCPMTRIPTRDVHTVLIESIASGYISTALMNKKLREKLNTI